MSFKANRRKALVALCTIAVTGPTVAAATVSDADAELLAAGKAFSDLLGRYEVVRETIDPLSRQHHEQMARFREEHPNGTAKEYWLEYGRNWQAIVGSLPHESLDDIVGAMDPHVKRILRLPATTLSGLAVKALVAKFFCDFWWDQEPGDLDLHEHCARDVIDNILRLDATA